MNKADLQAKINTLASEKASELLNLLVFNRLSDEQIANQPASYHHHDNIKGGWLAHINKMLNICQLVIGQYRSFFYNNTDKPIQSNIDLLICSVVLHDIGKFDEQTLDGYTEIGNKLTHTTLCICLLAQNKQQIVDLYDEDFFIDLLSAIAGHHNGYNSESAKSVIAQILFEIDNFESDLTEIEQKYRTSVADDKTFVTFDGRYLYL
jgi:23S rRNA maturation-related 3'-5' exoribonuclease YhaM